MSRSLSFRLLLAAVLACLACAAGARERVLAFDQDVQVLADGSLEVIETITVRAEGSAIRRGIYREFPTRYRDRLGNRVAVGFEVLGVERDGRPEPFFTEDRANGVRINTGDDALLDVPATIRYTLRYRTTRQLGFFDDHDELYWNVTGNGWALPIEAASARITLPSAPGADAIAAEAYTGAYGARGREARVETRADGALVESTRGLAPEEGMTAVVAFPKGLVAAPSQAQRVAWLLRDNLGLIVIGLGLAGVLAMYLVGWLRHGRDPRPGTIIPRYEPPAGHTAGGVRFMTKIAYDDAAFTADVVQLAVDGFLRIHHDIAGKEPWRLEITAEGRIGPPDDPGQRAVLAMFAEDRRVVAIGQDNAALLDEARTGHGGALHARYRPAYMRANGGWLFAGIAASLATAVLAFAVSGGHGIGLIAAGVLLLVALNVVFGILMRAPTAKGRALLDEIEGFRLYLRVAEREELARLGLPGNEPPLDGGRYQALLPYALALDLEEAWTARFTEAVGEAAARRELSGSSWMLAPGFIGASAQDIGRALGASLSSQIASATTPPGSSPGSSSFGGGGFSGGGGGGGGGGGR
ncbi:DUF2207 domain-containing protein [Coralloluteibacterium stylophorae]|uniref:DUF2207 domain-containing protein n=1 Tax=Coralloluteibacterium stylophorae TaxID=1776034 RepID=A0A8J7VSA2_9GAMM|nr:DUF2207 domain-containing protein [Coralloluteibacterium stylophorae]MBS7455855.1 DUF2207 domain-containing protein [Coralloluteibacterium stylophorae]